VPRERDERAEYRIAPPLRDRGGYPPVESRGGFFGRW
jgi:hypothetical protein